MCSALLINVFVNLQQQIHFERKVMTTRLDYVPYQTNEETFLMNVSANYKHRVD